MSKLISFFLGLFVSDATLNNETTETVGQMVKLILLVLFLIFAFLGIMYLVVHLLKI